jgi:hypothetical protein
MMEAEISTKSINLDVDVEEFSTGWCYRFPGNDPTAQWRGPYLNEQAATDAGIAAIEEFMTYHVADMLGLSN